MKKLSLLFFCLMLSTANAKQVRIETFQASVTPEAVDNLTGIACRNFDKIVRLKIDVTWPVETGSAEPSGYERLIFATSDSEFLFPKGTYTYMHGSWVVDGYFIVTSGGMHMGTVSYAFTPVDMATVLLNPHVKEFSVNGPCT